MKFYSLALIALLFVFSCKKDQSDESSGPSIILTIQNSASTLNFSAALNNLPMDEIKETGFIWSKNPDPTFLAEDVYSYNSTTPSDNFSYAPTAGFSKDSTYYVKAYYIDATNNYHYSTKSSFIAGGTKGPILSYTSNYYTWGDTVALGLENMRAAKLTDISIYISSDIISKPIKMTGKEIYFVIPENIQQQTSPLYITVYGQKSNEVYLTLIFPMINDNSDKELSDGVLKITGRYFNPVLSRNIVKIGEVTLDVISGSTTELNVKANNLALSEAGPLSVKTGENLSSQSDKDYYAYKYFKSKKDFPGESRTDAKAFLLGGSLYCGLGRSNLTSLAIKDWWKYDITNDTWTRMADCPVPIQYAASFTAANKAYVGVGLIDNFRSPNFYSYTPATDTWVIETIFPDEYVPRSASFSTREAGYIIGGDTDAGRSSAVWKYTPATRRWNKLKDFPGQPTSFANTFIIGNKGYYVGGTGTNNLSKDAWSFDFSSETWQKIADLPNEAGSFAGFSFALNGKGYVGGGAIEGRFSGDASSFVYEYNPTSNSWKEVDKIVDAVRYLSAFAADGDTGYIITGSAYQNNDHSGIKKFLQFKP